MNELTGFMIDETHFVEIPEGDFIIENEDGSCTIQVNVYEVKENNFERIDPEKFSQELSEKVETAVNTMLNAAIEYALSGEEIDEASDYETVYIEDENDSSDDRKD